MDWRFVGKQSFSKVVNSIEFTRSLSQNVIAIDVDSPLKKDTWNRAGEIIQVLPVPDFPNGLDIAGSFTQIGFAPTLIKFDVISGNPYRIKFKPVPWLKEFTLLVWQYYGPVEPSYFVFVPPNWMNIRATLVISDSISATLQGVWRFMNYNAIWTDNGKWLDSEVWRD